MRIKLGENMPTSLVPMLGGLGHDVDTAPEEGLRSQPDGVILHAAASEGRFLISQDLDLSDVRWLSRANSTGVLILRLHEPGLYAIEDRVMQLARAFDLTDWLGCIVIATQHKVRTRRIPASS